MREIYKSIKRYEGLYEVSNLGNVKSLGNNQARKERILKPSPVRGYLGVCLCINNIKKTIPVHKLVWKTFNGDIPKGLELDHIVEGNKYNNRLDNLQLLTTRENLQKHYKTKKSSSKYLGVSWNKRGKKWTSSIYINGKLKRLGSFTDELEASKAYENELKTLKT